MNDQRKPLAHGRGSSLNPPNRFERIEYVDDFDQVDADEEFFESRRKIPTEYLADQSKTIVSTNDSPDIFFNYSINPYRGCQHGCAYCYQRSKPAQDGTPL